MAHPKMTTHFGCALTHPKQRTQLLALERILLAKSKYELDTHWS